MRYYCGGVWGDMALHFHSQSSGRPVSVKNGWWMTAATIDVGLEVCGNISGAQQRIGWLGGGGEGGRGQM